jgi:heme o synthase
MNGWKMTGGSHVLSMGSLPAVIKDRIFIFFELTKLHLTSFIALSAMFGQVIAAAFFSRDTLAAGGGVWLLAAGAAVLNNIQDRDYDRRFSRTRHRCLPQKKVPVHAAALLSLALICAGLAVLFGYPDTPLPGFLGLMALACYNGLYTPLKKKTFLAVWPGVFCGMLPPAIGWTAVTAPGGKGSGQDLVILMLVLGIWQVPHFLALRAGRWMLKAGGPCELDHETSVFPCLARWWTKTEIQLQILIWVSLYSLAILLFLIRGGISSPEFSMILAAMALVLPAGMAWLQKRGSGRPGGPGFAVVNLSLLVFMVLGIMDRTLTGIFPFL